MGYTNPYVLLQFPELGDDVSILMKNPQLLPPTEITPEDVPLDDKGQPLDPQAANEAMYSVFARIIVAWKVYEAFGGGDAPDIAEDADPVALFESLEVGGQQRLGAITVESIGRLPMVIIKRIMGELERVVDPQ